MTTIINIVSILAIFVFFVSVFNYLMGIDGSLEDLIQEVKKTENKKKLILFLFIHLPLYSLWAVSESCIRLCFLILLIFSFPFNVEIKAKNLNDNLINYCSSNWKIKELIIEILKENYKESYNRTFSIFYKIISKKKKRDYKKSLEMLGFSKITGISKTYLFFIIKLSKKKNKIKKNKIWYIKLIIYIRTHLLYILWTINCNFFEKMLIDLESIKIKTNFLKIKTNGGGQSRAEKVSLVLKRTKNIVEYRDMWRTNSKPHIVVEMEKEDGIVKYGLTRSTRVKVWEENGEVKNVESIECGKTNSGKQQYAIPLAWDKTFDERYETRENLSKEVINGFGLDNFHTYLGKKMEVGAHLLSSEHEKGISRGINSKEIELKSKPNKDIAKENIKEIEKMSHEEIGKKVYKDLTIEQKFEIQKEFYDKIEKTKKEENYYDKD